MGTMLSMDFLAQILNFDAYDQPGVERTKLLTKEILGNLSR